jgi:predicted nuclease with TOPRIM domain
LLHWVVGTSVPPLKSLALGFAVFALIVWFWRINESEFMELRSRAKEMNSKLDDVSAKLDDLMERLEEKGEEQMGEQISDVVERLDRIEHEQGRLHEHLQEFGSKLAQ